eukprot:7554871-Pyramimonas_sp.AAC.1
MPLPAPPRPSGIRMREGAPRPPAGADGAKRSRAGNLANRFSPVGALRAAGRDAARARRVQVPNQAAADSDALDFAAGAVGESVAFQGERSLPSE